MVERIIFLYGKLLKECTRFVSMTCIVRTLLTLCNLIATERALQQKFDAASEEAKEMHARNPQHLV